MIPGQTDPVSALPCADITVDPGTLSGDSDGGTGRACFGTVAALHAAPTAVDGDVISWRWSASAPPVGEVPLASNQAGYNPVQIEAQVRNAFNLNTVTDPTLLRALLYNVSDYDPNIGTGNIVTSGLRRTRSPKPSSNYTSGPAMATTSAATRTGSTASTQRACRPGATAGGS